MKKYLRSFLLAYDASPPLEEEVAAETTDDGLDVIRLSYTSTHGQRVPALFVKRMAAQAMPAVLLQHGGGDSKDERHMLLIARRLAQAGFAVLSIDAPDHGERARGSEAPLSSARRRLFYQQRDNRIQNIIDLRRGIDYLEARPEVDRERVGYWGISMGASLGVPLLAVEERVRAACLVLGGASRRAPPEGVEPAHVEMARLVLDPVMAAPLQGERPVLMLNGLTDPTIPAEAARELFEALPGPKGQQWFPAGHNLSGGMIKATVAFFRQTLAGEK